MRKKIIIATALVLLAANGAIAQSDPSLKLELGAEYSSGDYSTPNSIRVFYMPLSAEYSKDRFIGKVTIPYISVSYTSQVPTQPIQVGGPGQPGPVTRPQNQALTSTNSGIGDVILSAGYRALTDHKSGIYVTPKVLLKLGTASDAQGLGTGEHDFSLQVDLARVFHPVTVFGYLGYTIVGDPFQTNFEDSPYARLGLDYDLGGAQSAGAYLEYHQSSSPSLDSRFDGSVYMIGPIEDDLSYSLYVKGGFTSSVPDWTLGASLIYTAF